MAHELEPSALLVRHGGLLGCELPGPVLDLACGECHNGIFVSQRGQEVICCDRAAERLAEARRIAQAAGVRVTTWELDLEAAAENPLPEEFYGAILVFRYLHRPLIPSIRKALRPSGLLFYETFTAAQAKFGRPHNPHHLLGEGELRGWFDDWEVIHYFEGIEENPMRAIAQLVCRKPGGVMSEKGTTKDTKMVAVVREEGA
jgi:tellurite methyltransferase